MKQFIEVNVVIKLTTDEESMFHECFQIDPDIRGGVPVLKGTRFTIAQVFAELAEGRSVTEIAKAFRLDEEQLKKVLNGFAIYLDRTIAIK